MPNKNKQQTETINKEATNNNMEQSAQPNQTQPETPTNTPVETTPPGSSKTMLYVLSAVGVLALLLVGYFVIRKPSLTTRVPQQPVISQPTLSPKPTLPRSKAPGVITNVVTASTLDAQGKAVAPATTFAKTDKNIYLVLSVNKPKIGTKIEYIRYLNGKYLDSGANKILKSNVTNTSFIWSLIKPGTMHLVGTYKVKVYTNGIFEKEISYTVN